MLDTGGAAKIRVDATTGHARFVELSGRSMRDHNGKSHTVLAQSYEGVPVFGGELRAHFNRDGELTVANGMFVAGLKVNTTPTLAADVAEGRAIRAVILEEARKIHASRRADDLFSTFDESRYSDLNVYARDLLIFREGLVRGTPGADHLAYRVEVRDARGSIREFVFVDAHSGKVIDQITGIYDAEGQPHPGPNYPATPFWVEGQALPTTDVEADNMIYASGETYDLFAMAFGRDSFDGLGARMDAIFNRGHEWGHAYTQYTNNLNYQWQSGALSESLPSQP